MNSNQSHSFTAGLTKKALSRFDAMARHDDTPHFAIDKSSASHEGSYRFHRAEQHDLS